MSCDIKGFVSASRLAIAMVADPYAVTIIILSKLGELNRVYTEEIESKHNCYCKFDQGRTYKCFL